MPAHVPQTAPCPCLARCTNSLSGSKRRELWMMREMAELSPPGMMRPWHSASCSGVRTAEAVRIVGRKEGARILITPTCSAKEPWRALWRRCGSVAHAGIDGGVRTGLRCGSRRGLLSSSCGKMWTSRRECGFAFRSSVFEVMSEDDDETMDRSQVPIETKEVSPPTHPCERRDGKDLSTILSIASDCRSQDAWRRRRRQRRPSNTRLCRPQCG